MVGTSAERDPARASSAGICHGSRCGCNDKICCGSIINRHQHSLAADTGILAPSIAIRKIPGIHAEKTAAAAARAISDIDTSNIAHESYTGGRGSAGTASTAAATAATILNGCTSAERSAYGNFSTN